MGGVNLVCRFSIRGSSMADLVDRNKPLIQYGDLNTLLLRLESYLEISRIAGSES